MRLAQKLSDPSTSCKTYYIPPRVKTQILFITLLLFWPRFNNFLAPFYDILILSMNQPQSYQVQYCTSKTGFQQGRSQKTLFIICNLAQSHTKEYIIVFNFNIMQTVQSSLKTAAIYFSLPDNHFSPFSSFCKSSANLRFLSVPT